MHFEIGDVQILNSHVTMHSRTAYEDWPDPEKRRRLWRLWLRNPDIRPRPKAFAHRTEGIRTPPNGFTGEYLKQAFELKNLPSNPNQR